VGFLAISPWLKDVVIPLIAAALTAAGIVVPLWYQRRKDRAEEARRFDKALLALHRDAAFLAKRADLLVTKGHTGEAVTDQEIDAISSARERLIKRLFDDPLIYDAYFGRKSWLTGQTEATLLLLLGEIDTRLRRLQTTRAMDVFTLFGLYLLQYAGETDPAVLADLTAAIGGLRQADSEVDFFAKDFPV
jgi:hypothetical protein